MSPLEQAVVQLQTELHNTRVQMATMASSHAALSNAHTVLKTETEKLLAEKNKMIADAENRLQQLLFNQVLCCKHSREGRVVRQWRALFEETIRQSGAQQIPAKAVLMFVEYIAKLLTTQYNAKEHALRLRLGVMRCMLL